MSFIRHRKVGPYIEVIIEFGGRVLQLGLFDPDDIETAKLIQSMEDTIKALRKPQ